MKQKTDYLNVGDIRRMLDGLPDDLGFATGTRSKNGTINISFQFPIECHTVFPNISTFVLLTKDAMPVLNQKAAALDSEAADHES